MINKLFIVTALFHSIMNSNNSCHLDIKLIETSVNKIELFFEKENISHNEIIVVMTDDDNIQCISEHFSKTNITSIAFNQFKKIYSKEKEPNGLIIYFPRILYSTDVDTFNVKFYSSLINLDGTLKLSYKIRNNVLYSEGNGIYVWHSDDSE